ncbi:DUF933 domain-containing protein [Klebsiella pneumoniae subsp. pneumoniae]|nr:DUF933 domain-containing protein [Klebsiella pneumoniae subsp. pneumoniae]
MHTDFEKVLSARRPSPMKTLLPDKGEQGAKEAGKMRAEGKDYIVKKMAM